MSARCLGSVLSLLLLYCSPIWGGEGFSRGMGLMTRTGRKNALRGLDYLIEIHCSPSGDTPPPGTIH